MKVQTWVWHALCDNVYLEPQCVPHRFNVFIVTFYGGGVTSSLF